MQFEDSLSVPDHFYRNHLPHFDPKDAPYFVTYRLNGSIPNAQLQPLIERHKSAETELDQQRLFDAFDALLHTNGPYHLQRAEIRDILIDSLAHLDRNEIQLYAYAIMPNHVHAVFDLRSGRKLYEVMQSHKTYTARRANSVLGSVGQFWQRETYDRVVRKGRLGPAIWYTIFNPVKAGLVRNWEDWPGTYLAPDCRLALGLDAV
ncbi:MAG: transposase [Bacteroidota bacterium]|nr:transposase [Bacteroidota bacterium]